MIIIYKVTLINGTEETVINVVSVRKDVPRLKSGVIKKGINTIDSFTFAVGPENPGYNKINLRTTLVNILNTKTNKYEFQGRVLIPTESMGSEVPTKSLVCESELGYLQDSTQTYGEYHDATVRGFFETIIAQHNSQVEDYKKFTVGNVTVMDPNDSLYRFLGYDKTLDTIKDKLISRLGGELQIRHEDGIMYLDYLQRIGEKKNTVLNMNKNMKTIEQKKDPSSVITRLKPLGTKLNGTEERLTIASVNNGNEYLDNLEGQSTYGINQGVMYWDDVTKPINLMNKGVVALNDATKVLKQYKIGALELALIEKDPDLLEVGCDYRTVNSFMSVDEDLRIVNKTIDILNPKENQLTIGDKFETMYGKQSSVQKTAAYVQSITTGNGNISGSFLSGYMDLLRVQMGAMADTAEKQQAKAILFEDKVADSPSFGAMALGTQGFMISDQIDENGEWIFKTFGTGKGFTADLIVAGTILANMIKGGTLSSTTGNLKIGLDDDKFILYDGTNAAIQLSDQQITFFDWLVSGLVNGYMGSSRIIDAQGNATGNPVIGVNAEYGIYIDLGYKRLSNSQEYDPAIRIRPFDNDPDNRTTQIMTKEFTVLPNKGTSKFAVDDTKAQFWTDFYLHGWDIHNIGSIHDDVFFDGSEININPNNGGKGFKVNTTGNFSYADLDMGNHGLTNVGSLQVSGSKNCVQSTTAGDKLFYANEWDTPYLGRPFFGKTQNNKAIIYLDNILRQCLNTEIDYIIQFNPLKFCEYEIIPHEDYIEIDTDRDVEYSCIIMGKRIGYEGVQLQEANNPLFITQGMKSNHSDIMSSLLSTDDTKKNELLNFLGTNAQQQLDYLFSIINDESQNYLNRILEG